MMVLRLLLPVYLLSLPVIAGFRTQHVTARTAYGRVRGTRTQPSYQLNTGTNIGIVDKYLGVPYAAPPTGSRRFAPPEKPAEWERDHDATRYGSACPQMVFHYETRTELQSEDCLYLDIYTPFEDSEAHPKYPVMVYIHGGSFEVGSGRLYEGSVLAQYGVVVVSINYRLGALGFLTAADDIIPGNYGLKDQVEALRWVQENIANFRGDPDKVTIFGHSAGGASVGLLLVIPAARGLFHRAVGQSGSAIATYSVHEKQNVDFQLYISLVGQLFDCDGNTSEILTCLRKVPAQAFISQRQNFPLYDPIDPEFRPSVDNKFILNHPRKSYINGDFYRVPIIVGTVENEFGNYFNGGARYNRQFDIALDEYVLKFATNQGVNEVIKYVYQNWDLDIYDRGSLLSDMHMVAPTVDMAKLVSLHTRDIYQYHFSTRETYHSVELNYIFGAPFSGHFADEMTTNGSVDNFDEKQRQQSTRVMTLWSNFAKYGEPTPHNNGRKWIEFNNTEANYLLINYEGNEMKRDLRVDKVSFWNDFIPTIKDKLPSKRLNTSAADTSGIDIICETQWIFFAFTIGFPLLVIILAVVLIRMVLKNSKQQREAVCNRHTIPDAEDGRSANDTSSTAAECKAVLL